MEKTFKLLEAYVEKRTSKLNAFPEIVQKGINTIAGEIPFKLKLSITLSELITFSSHLRKPIRLYDGTLVPTNAITFALSASGTSKDRSLNTVRGAMDIAISQLEDQRRKYAREKAEKKAQLEGLPKGDWEKFYIPPKSLQAGLGTVEGLVNHFAEIAQNPLGAGSIMSSEIGSELQTNGAMTDIIKTISQGYDLGNINAKIVKASENQTAEIKCLPINAIFFGSQEAILFNNDIKAKFKLVFNTQLARRSIFSFTPENPIRPEITDIDQFHELREEERKRVLRAQEELRDLTAELIYVTNQEPLELTPEATKLFDIYMEYNAMLSDSYSNKYPISKLSRKHKQWLALKLGGTYAILKGDREVTEESYAYAINTVELLSNDLQEFEKELIKEPYEQLVDFCKFSAENSEFFISLHELRKMSYIGGAGSSKTKLEELVTMANSYDENGSYSVQENGIQYKELVKTDIVGVSYIIYDTLLKGEKLKNYMKVNCDIGYEFFETTFEDIELLLKENAAYGCFRFIDGKHSKDNLIGGTKFVVLDIDKSMLTDEEAHVLLNEYNHYIVRTSDPDNEFKFRAILELDAVVETDAIMWKAFIEEIGEELGIIVDPVPQSQIFFSYANRNVLMQLEGKTLATKFLLENAAIRVRDKPKPARTLPPKEKTLKLEDPRTTFNYAFEAEKGNRSISMYKALMHAIDIGADEDYLKALAYEINGYWSIPMDKDRLEHTLLTPALRRL